MSASWVALALLALCAAPSVLGNTINDGERAELTFEASQQFATLQRLIDAATKVPTAAFLRERLAMQVKDAVKDALLRLRTDRAKKFEAKEALVTKHAVVSLGAPVESKFEQLKSQVTASKSFGAKIEKLCSDNMGDKDDCERKATQAVFCQLLKRKEPALAALNCRQTDTHLLEASEPTPTTTPTEVAEPAVKLPTEASEPAPTNKPTEVAEPAVKLPTASVFEQLKRQVRGSKSFAAKVTALCQKAADKVACEEKATDAVFCKLLERKKPELAAQHCKAPGKETVAQYSETPLPPLQGAPQSSDASASSLPEGAQLEKRIDDKIGPDMGAVFRKLENGRQGVDSQLADLRAAEVAESDPAKKAGIHADVVRLAGIQSQMATHFANVAKLFHT